MIRFFARISVVPVLRGAQTALEDFGWRHVFMKAAGAKTLWEAVQDGAGSCALELGVYMHNAPDVAELSIAAGWALYRTLRRRGLVGIAFDRRTLLLRLNAYNDMVGKEGINNLLRATIHRLSPEGLQNARVVPLRQAAS